MIKKSIMYLHLKSFYDQWCSGQDDDQIISRSEVFIDMIHDKVGYNTNELREFLYRQSWFKKEL